MSDALVLAAAGLLVGIGAAHSLLGERYILVRLFRRPLPPLFGDDWFTRQTLRFAWHVTTVAWLGFAAVLVLAARGGSDGAAGVRAAVAGTFLVTAVIAAVASRGRHLSWPVFLTVAVLAWLA